MSTHSARPAPRRAHPTAVLPLASGSGPFAIAERTVPFVDNGRHIRLRNGHRIPRPLSTEIFYPTHPNGTVPLIVFGHGFAVTPAPYTALLQAWARAGFVVAAPIFPLENANAPGGPNENDLINQPRDMRFVIGQVLKLSAAPTGFLAGEIAPTEIAVSGQSDGGETALAVAYDRYYLDRRVKAAAILSGAEIPGIGGFSFPAPSPPLLATQGTVDVFNLPHFTYDFFRIAPAPKFLLTMYGASHLAPYTTEQPQLGIVERVSIAFFDHYLKGWPRALGRIRTAGDVAGVTGLRADS